MNTLAAHEKLSRYVVKSSDVISDMRVNISEEHSEKVVWYKERFLSDEEIVEHVVHNQTSTICWTIHRPKRGWYIRIRAPSFPPGVFISLMPLERSSQYYTEAALSFSCRTNIPDLPSTVAAADSRSPPSTTKSSIDTDLTLLDTSSTAALHSYPPTPTTPGPSLVIHPPSPTSVHAKLDELTPQRKVKTRPPRTQISKFVLAPHSSPHVPQIPEQSSFITRALSAFKNNKPSHSSSFTLCPIPPSSPDATPGTHSPPFPAPSSVSQASPSSALHHHHLSHLLPRSPVPLLIFHDRTPLLTVRSTNGILEIDRAEEQRLGVQVGFWIAVALTYLEFLEERESYLAAVSD